MDFENHNFIYIHIFRFSIFGNIEFLGFSNFQKYVSSICENEKKYIDYVKKYL